MPSVVLNLIGFGDYWEGATEFPAILRQFWRASLWSPNRIWWSREI